MDHVAILQKSKISKGDNLLRDILEGRKTIESRWYVNKISPWDKVKKGDTIYFKESGYPVTAKSRVSRVIQFDNLNVRIVEDIITKYGNQISPDTTLEEWLTWAKTQNKKNYCILLFLEDVEKIVRFNIDKTGYGSSSAWLSVGDIFSVKR